MDPESRRASFRSGPESGGASFRSGPESGGASFRSGPERRTNESGKRGASFRDEPESRGCFRSGSESRGKSVGVIQKVGRKPCTWTRKFAFI